MEESVVSSSHPWKGAWDGSSVTGQLSHLDTWETHLPDTPVSISTVLKLRFSVLFTLRHESVVPSDVQGP